MTLSFKTKINGKKTLFAEKILSGLAENKLITDESKVIVKDFYGNNLNFYPLKFVNKKLKPKIHTIREDIKDRWKPGNNIHFVINNRSKNRFQFAPVIPVISTQEVLILPYAKEVSIHSNSAISTHRVLSEDEIEILSKNDGFDSVYDFWKYFKEPIIGKLIHWTDYEY